MMFSSCGSEDSVKASATLGKSSTWLSVAPKTLNLPKVLLLLRQEGFVLEALELKAELSKGTDFTLQLPMRIMKALFDTCQA